MTIAAKKILVTGGAGFIGSHTVVDLVENGYEPIIIDDFSNSSTSVLDGLEEICGRPIVCLREDCGHPDALRGVFREHGPFQAAIHFAASKAVGESQEKPLLYYRNNLGSLIALLDVMGEFGVHDLVFSSSCVVYGEPDSLPVTESTPIKPPASVYGATKQMCEALIRDVVRSGAPLRAVSLRYFNPVGAHESAKIGELPIGRPQNLFPVIMQSAAGLSGPVRVFGGDWSTPDGSCIRDYIHVLDLAHAHVRSLEWLAEQDAGARDAVFNVGTGKGVSVLEAIDAFQRATGQKLDYDVAERRDGDIEQIFADASHAEKELRWKAVRTLDQAMCDAWRWQEKLDREREKA